MYNASKPSEGGECRETSQVESDENPESITNRTGSTPTYVFSVSYVGERMNTSGLGRTLRDKGTNAVLAWLLIAVVTVIAIATFESAPLWAGFAVVVAVLSVIPSIVVRSPRAMLPWEVLALAAFPLLVRPTGTPGSGQIATYLAVATVALIVAVELHVFTSVEMNYSFAIFFVVVTTMACAGVWAVVRWSAANSLGIGFELSHRRLMLEFVASTIAGVFAGIVFELYFRRFVHARERLQVDL